MKKEKYTQVHFVQEAYTCGSTEQKERIMYTRNFIGGKSHTNFVLFLSTFYNCIVFPIFEKYVHFFYFLYLCQLFHSNSSHVNWKICFNFSKMKDDYGDKKFVDRTLAMRLLYVTIHGKRRCVDFG